MLFGTGNASRSNGQFRTASLHSRMGGLEIDMAGKTISPYVFWRRFAIRLKEQLDPVQPFRRGGHQEPEFPTQPPSRSARATDR